MSGSNPNGLVCAVTGANGYVGSVIATHLSEAGIKVVPLQRSGGFQLGAAIAPGIFGGANCLVHCAYDFGARGRNEIWWLNVEGSLALFKSAREAGVKRIVFISTMSAFEGCISLYGQAKMAVENAASELDLLVVRPGLVYGKRPRGMVGSLLKLSGLPLVMPLVGWGGQRLYLAHEEDLGRLICKLIVEGGEIGAPVVAASEKGLSLRKLVESMGGRGKIPLPIPGGLMWCGLKMAEAMGMKLRVRSDSLVSLLNQNPSPDFSQARKMGIGFREFDETSLGASLK